MCGSKMLRDNISFYMYIVCVRVSVLTKKDKGDVA